LEFGLTVDVNGLNGFVHVSEIAWKKVENLKELYKAGDKVEAKIIVVDTQKKSVKLSIKQTKVDPWNKAAEKYNIGDEVKVKVLRLVNFGAFVELEEGVEGLIHVSDLSWGKKVNIEDFVKPGDEITAVITDIKPEEKKIRIGVKQLKKDPWEGALAKYAIGAIVEAKIVEVKEFGIFAEIEEGIDIFIHVSDLKWERADTSAYKSGDKIKAKVIEIDGESKKIKGSVKALEKSPWEVVSEKYKVGQKLKRKVESITAFGLFVEVENGIDGMIHISQASSEFVKKLEDKFKVGDEVEAEIIEIDAEHKKIKLSIKKIEDSEEEKESKELLEKYGTSPYTSAKYSIKLYP
jgi:ribosomal protein S1